MSPELSNCQRRLRVSKQWYVVLYATSHFLQIIKGKTLHDKKGERKTDLNGRKSREELK